MLVQLFFSKLIALILETNQWCVVDGTRPLELLAWQQEGLSICHQPNIDYQDGEDDDSCPFEAKLE